MSLYQHSDAREEEDMAAMDRRGRQPDERWPGLLELVRTAFQVAQTIIVLLRLMDH